MREIEKSGIRLDICPGCKGIWLDRGELEKLMETAASGGTRSETSYGAKSYDKHDDHEHKEHYGNYDHREHGERGYGERKRRGSWLGEILGGFGGGDD
jgi:Zn-finger nucleic acid-binding protein